ncbi:MAG: hypothetical protein GY724_24940 [Actinomycetia bacterium]|nr:hypothetical protein [Actinomycetes bacterium]MCP4226897.1 hypothetical protein [Actinomycetes bacterium]MCP5034773.1 hypothetical protein [Actinomycetes bacterium]
MNLASRLAALVLAAVLVWAAGAKAMRPTETARQFDDIGLRGAKALAIALPLIELATGVLLVISPGWGGVVAFALLAGFTVILARLVYSGRPVPCHCFGGSSTEPVSTLSLVRNGCLLALAAMATVG